MKNEVNSKWVNKYSELWQDIFQDDKTFIEKYFATFLNYKTFYHISEKDNLISCLIACEYQWLWHKMTFPFAYLSGILTDNKFRGQGFASKLINHTLNNLYIQEFYLCGLIAAKNSLVYYYNRFEFIKCNNSAHEIFSKNSADEILMSKYIFVTQPNIMNNQYSKFFTCIDNAVKHTNNTLSLYNNEEYLRFCVTYRGTNKAFAVGKEMKDFIELLHIDFNDLESKQVLLSFIAKKLNKDVKISTSHNTMIRIINVRKILELYATKSCFTDMRIHITDDIIQENNIMVEIKDGKLRDVENSYGIKTVSIKDLTTMLFSNGRMFLMLDR